MAFNTITGCSIAEADIKYVGREGTIYKESSIAPSGAGKYTAKITIERATASVDYEIVKVDDPMATDSHANSIPQPITETSVPASVVEKVTIPKTPAKMKVKARKNKVVVSWKKIKKNKKTKALRAMIKGIEVQYSTDLAFPKETTVTKIIGKNKTKLVLRGLQRKTMYYIRVRYVGTDGVSSWKTKHARTK